MLLSTHPKPLDQAGFTLVEIMMVLAVLGLLLGIALPAFARRREFARQQLCISNLGQIESAKQRWGVEQGKSDGDLPAVSDLIGGGSYIPRMPECPAGGVYSFRVIGTNATCTIPGHSLP